jgi:hypothetical protein
MPPTHTSPIAAAPPASFARELNAGLLRITIVFGPVLIVIHCVLQSRRFDEDA